MTDDEMVIQVEQFLRDNPPLTTAALRAKLAAERARADALAEALMTIRQMIGTRDARIYATDKPVRDADAALAAHHAARENNDGQ